MKNVKKIAALILTASMMLSVAGCGGGNKLAPKKLIAAAKDYGCEKMDDADDLADMILEGEDLEDGAYITVSGRDAKDIFKANDALSDLYDSSISTATVVAICDDDRTYYAFVVCMTFGSIKEAEEYYEDCVDGTEDVEDYGYDVELDDGEEKGIKYTCVTADIGVANIAEGLYQSGVRVVAVVGYGFGAIDDYEDFFEDVAGCYDIILPSDI